MSTFNLIFRLIVDAERATSSFSVPLSIVIKGVQNALAYDGARKPREKLACVYDTVRSSPVLDDNIKNKVTSVFFQAQKHYMCLHRFRHRCRTIFGKRRGASLDMQLLHIGDVKPHLTVTVWQNRATYKFRVSDMINVFTKSLLTSSHLFPWPEPPKNPYTNVPFPYSVVLHLYWAIKHSHFKMPLVIELYHSCDFDHDRLLLEHEPILKRHVIADFVRNGCESEKAILIREMLAHNSSITRKLTPHFSVPDHMYVAAFGSMLHNYLLSTSACTDNQRYRYRHFVRTELKRFIKQNSCWGRRIIFLNNREDCKLQPADLMYVNRYSENPLAEPVSYVTH